MTTKRKRNIQTQMQLVVYLIIMLATPVSHFYVNAIIFVMRHVQYGDACLSNCLFLNANTLFV